MTTGGTTPGSPEDRSDVAPADAGADVAHLVRRRDLRVPAEDQSALADYWSHMRQLRAAVDEQLLADSEIAVTWSPAEAPRAR